MGTLNTLLECKGGQTLGRQYVGFSGKLNIELPCNSITLLDIYPKEKNKTTNH